MAVFQLGPIIRNRRVELGLSQEDLAEGICSVPTLSRIENGERMPTRNHFEMLMQRLGYSTTSFDFFTDKQNFLIHELKFKIRQAYVLKDSLLTKQLLDEYKELISDDSQIDQQFLILFQTLLDYEKYTGEEVRSRYEAALRLTCPSYNSSHLPYVLSYEEITLLNSIAISYDVTGTRCQAIVMLQALKEYYDNHVINLDEALRTQPMILYNLSKMLGLEARFDECLEVCDQGIALARKTARCSYLGKTLYNRAWALAKRNHEGDLAAAAEAAMQARNFFQLMGDTAAEKFVCNFIKANNLDVK